MTDASTSLGMSTGLRKVAERAKREPAGRFHSLAHLIDEELLAGVYHRLRGDAAVGVDGITKEQYGQELQSNLYGLHERPRTKRYRHQPIRRVHIPKDKGRTRPIGVSATEDKVVQGALREVLQAIYEQDFLACSYGFRPGRSAHDAVRALTRAVDEGEANWILEFDVVSFFDSVDRKHLMEMLHRRVADGSILRLVGKCLHVGVLDGAEFSEPSVGTVQGSTLSPLLGTSTAVRTQGLARVGGGGSGAGVSHRTLRRDVRLSAHDLSACAVLPSRPYRLERELVVDAARHGRYRYDDLHADRVSPPLARHWPLHPGVAGALSGARGEAARDGGTLRSGATPPVHRAFRRALR